MNFSDFNHDCDETKKNINTLGLVFTIQSSAGYQHADLMKSHKVF